MRKLLMIASAAAMAVSVPAMAKPDKGGKGGGGGPKAEHKAHGGGGGHGNGWKGDKGPKWERGDGRGREFRAERKLEKHEFKAERNFAKAEQKADKKWRKAEAKADKQWAKREERVRTDDRRFGDQRRRERLDERALFRGDDRRLASGYDQGCPPGLARKNNGCLPPGQAKKLYRVGEVIPAAYLTDYNLPGEYRDWYYDTPSYNYRYDDGNIYRIDSQTNLISALIPLLGGGFSPGNLLPAGYDSYNLPTQYRDDFQDSSEAYYRYGDDAIYQVDPQTNMIESVVALLAGDLNVGQLLPTGYDTYNLPMDYRDQYADSDEAMYRYADGNIYEVDPQTRIIEAIVAQLV